MTPRPGESELAVADALPQVGRRLKRREDARLLTGRGNYVDDIQLPRTTHLAFIRSPHAHARIVAIDTAAAHAMPGVLRAVTAAEWNKAGLGKLLCVHPIDFSDGRPMNEALRPAFAERKVCHVGDIVAAVVAETREAALDAAEAVAVRYEPLPAVIATGKALDADAPVIHEQMGTNLVYELDRGDRAAVEAALAGAAHVTTMTLDSNRVTAMPMEPRAFLAAYDDARDETTLWATSQTPHLLRRWICSQTLHLPEHKMRVIAPDVGGGFGIKANFTPEVSTVVWMARVLGRPVKWVATRSESLLSDSQARDHVSTARMGFDRDGRIVALDVDTIAALGAYLSNFAPGIPGNCYPQTITGLYRTPQLHLRVRCVYTNTVPVDAYRGSGRPEATFVNERLLENGAREMGIDVMAMRRRNLIAANQFPYQTPIGRIYDSGNPPRLLDRLEASSRYRALREEQRRLRAEGTLLGIGAASFLDKSGFGPSRGMGEKGGLHGGFETAMVRVHGDGRATLFVGTHSHGQGHDITFAAIAADRLGIPVDDIDVVEGDTDRVPFGNGTWGSRSVSVGGAAVYIGCERVMTKARRIAAHVLGCDATDLTYENRVFSGPRTNRSLSFADVAAFAQRGAPMPSEAGFEPGLEATVFHDPPDSNNPLAMHLAVVIVDPETGTVRIREYHTIDDCGTIINPMIVEGQVHGGLAQGIGQAVMENVVYDRDGQLLSGSFMDYAMPRADDMPPELRLDFDITRTPSNPLGAKGGSETGTIGPPAVIGNAVVDALWHLGVRHVALPMTAETVWRALRGR